MFSEEIYLKYLKTENLGRKILVFNNINSTTAFLLENETPYYTVATAETQTAGRGRSGRKWVSEKGVNLYFSVNLPPMDIMQILPLNVAVGYAVCDALAGILDVKLKWPNDIMYDGKKLGGILFETSISGSKVEKVILGIGLNINMTSFAPEIVDTAVSLKSATGQTYNREEMLARVMFELERRLSHFSNGVPDIVSEWEKYSASLDKTISVHKNGVKSFYTERGISPSGFLIAEDSNGLKTEIVSGDVGYDFSS
jgi:BirA family biotin operon repressor/biotin-[acetyl-CoA-carboxylase] ligase